MSWTTPADIKAQVFKLWDKGMLLAALVNAEQRRDEALFPRRLTLKGPSSTELAEHFSSVRDWIAALQQEEGRGYRVVWREVNHRVRGQNSLPDEIWVDSLDVALGLIGKRASAERFATLVAETRSRRPELTAWLARRPLRALELAEDWARLLEIVAWLREHPRPGIYLRQVDIPGVHSKFIEAYRGVLSELLDLTLPPDAIQAEASGMTCFCCRYGFRDKPLRIRFRLLDPKLTIFPSATDQDITVNHDTFARLTLPVRRVFITENEINFLAFPSVAESLVIFGSGYGFEMLERAHWLRGCAVHYWGDLDTHGFAILDQLRVRLPHAESFLMDLETLLEHRPHWGKEEQPERRDLPRLSRIEAALYDDLRQNRLGQQLRLEQEKIGFSWVKSALGIVLGCK